MSQMTPTLGARNLLLNCAAARPGERLLIAYEPSQYAYFSDDAHECVAEEAKRMGLAVDVMDVGFDANNPRLSEELRRRMRNFDIILFLARLGDQLRFSDMPPGKRVIVSFALNAYLLGTGFGNAHHAAFLELKNAANSVISRADEVRITCPAGSDVTGKSNVILGPEVDTTIMRFPMSVFTPVPAAGFTGRVALSGFLTGTGSRYYDDYTIEFDGPVHALLSSGRLTGFEGNSLDVERANAHYDRVSTLFGIDRNFVHSWHAGIHPGCGFPWDGASDYKRWGGVAFGNPRILHFHTCGAYAPGEISWNMIDPTIEVDGIKYWDRGAFRAKLLPNGADILSRHPCVASLFEHPERDIGIPAAGNKAVSEGLQS